MADLRSRTNQIDSDDIKAARLIGEFVDVVISFGDTLKLFLLTNINEIFGFAAAVIASGFDLNENESIAIHCNDIYLTDLAVMEITFDDAKALFDKIGAGLILTEIALRYARCSALSSVFHVPTKNIYRSSSAAGNSSRILQRHSPY